MTWELAVFPEVSMGVVLFSVLKEILGTQELRPSCLTSPDKVSPSRQEAGCLHSAVPSLWGRNHRVLGYMAEGLVVGFF